MVYRVIGLMSGSSLDGLDIAYVEFQERAKKWEYEIIYTACYEYDSDWTAKLGGATSLSALEYEVLHSSYGTYLGEQVLRFIEENSLQYKVQLIASHGHTTFHLPAARTTSQLGRGSSIAATAGINVVSDLRAMDLAFGGQGAPLVPIGEKLLFPEYKYFLNIGGIANVSVNNPDKYIAFDVCPANRVLNMISAKAGKPYDDGGSLAAMGEVIPTLLDELNRLPYYTQSYPKSLANDFGTDTVFPMIDARNDDIDDALRTYVEHICYQIEKAIRPFQKSGNDKMLVTGGGAHNDFLVSRLRTQIPDVEIEVPSKQIVDFKEALVMAFIGVLRWREENNVMASVTGATRDSIGGAVWLV
jgi:anhydro-N-acetylmuramic acid kinase